MKLKENLHALGVSDDESAQNVESNFVPQDEDESLK